jgi:phosphatidylethanolamine/phosphatidyl-N-methylethanolamine N-methyltransferase
MAENLIWRGAAEVWRERAVFLQHWLRHPLGIGAAWPSGRAVATAMARQLPASRRGAVLELGGGTGSITHALLEAGCGDDELIVVEREAALAVGLRRRFPRLRVVEADARALDPVLRQLGIAALAAVVSSLPIKWLDRAGQRAVIEACFARLNDDGVFLQLTNAVVSPLPAAAFGLEARQVARLWSPVPPVQIWQYRRRAAATRRQ